MIDADQAEVDAFIPSGKVASRRRANGTAKSVASLTNKDRVNHPTSSHKDYTPEELAYIERVKEFKNRTGRKFPSWTEMLSVAKDMGYRLPSDPD